MNLQQIQAELALLHHRTDIAGGAVELSFINSFQKSLQRLGFFKGEDTSTTLRSPKVHSGSGILSLVFSAQSTPITDFRTYIDLVQQTPSYRAGLGIITREKAGTLYRSQVPITDTVWDAVCPTKTLIDVYPPYTSTIEYLVGYWTFTLYYKKWLADLVSGTDSNYLTENGGDIIVMGTYALVLLSSGEKDEAMTILSATNTMANQFVDSEYGESGSGKEVLLRDLESILAKVSRAQLGSSS